MYTVQFRSLKSDCHPDGSDTEPDEDADHANRPDLDEKGPKTTGEKTDGGSKQGRTEVE